MKGVSFSLDGATTSRSKCKENGYFLHCGDLNFNQKASNFPLAQRGTLDFAVQRVKNLKKKTKSTVKRTTSQPVNQQTDQPTSEPTHRPAKQPASQPVNEPTDLTPPNNFHNV